MRKKTKRQHRKERIFFRATAAGVILVSIITVSAYARTDPDPAQICTVKIEAIKETTALNDISDNNSASGNETHIETETGQQESARTYADVKFVELPVNMKRSEQEMIFGICQDENVAFPLAMAIIENESQFNASERSSTGDSGLMQINDCNAERLADLGYTDLFDAETNVKAGTYILKELFEKYEDVTFVLMAYNMGEKGAQDAQKAGIYETEYSQGIETRAEQFSAYIDAQGVGK